MQPIIIIDSNSVYDCRTHSLIKSHKFDINVILGSFSQTIPKDQWQTKIKTISLLLLTRYPQEIPKIFKILKFQGDKTYSINEIHTQEEIQNMLLEILINNEKKQLFQSDQNEIERKLIRNNIQTQNIPQLSEDLQRKIPLTIGININSLVENLKGFCIKYPWWNQFYKRVIQSNNEIDAENILFEIAPILVERLHDLRNKIQNQDISTKQQNKQLEQIFQRLLELLNFDHLDVQFTEIKDFETVDEKFLEFLSILFQILKQMMQINATIEFNGNEATFSFTGVIQRFHDYSQDRLLIQSHMFAISLLENIRRKTQINLSTFEIAVNILERLIPDDDKKSLISQLKINIENNKQKRDVKEMTQDMKQQVQQQQMNYQGNQLNHNKKLNQTKQKQLDDYLKLEIARNQQKEEYFPKKKVKKVTKTITLDTSDESSFSFKGEEKVQKEQKPTTYYPKLGQQYQYPSEMYPYYNPYCWQYPSQFHLQNQYTRQQLQQIFNLGLEALNNRILLE